MKFTPGSFDRNQAEPIIVIGNWWLTYNNTGQLEAVLCGVKRRQSLKPHATLGKIEERAKVIVNSQMLSAGLFGLPMPGLTV